MRKSKMNLLFTMLILLSLKNFGQNDSIYGIKDKDGTSKPKVLIGLSMYSSIYQNGLIYFFPDFQVCVMKNIFSIGPSKILIKNKNIGVNFNYQRILIDKKNTMLFLKYFMNYQNVKINGITFPQVVPNNTGTITIKGKTVHNLFQYTLGFGFKEKLTNNFYLTQDIGLGLTYRNSTYTFYEDTSKEKAGDTLIKDGFSLLGLLNIGIEYYIK